MKKRIIVALLLAASLTTTVFAQETGKTAFRVSLGAGGMLNGNFSTWFVDKDAPGDLNRYNSHSLGASPYVFVDLKYAEISIGLGLGETGFLEHSNKPRYGKYLFGQLPEFWMGT